MVSACSKEGGDPLSELPMRSAWVDLSVVLGLRLGGSGVTWEALQVRRCEFRLGCEVRVIGSRREWWCVSGVSPMLTFCIRGCSWQ